MRILALITLLFITTKKGYIHMRNEWFSSFLGVAPFGAPRMMWNEQKNCKPSWLRFIRAPPLKVTRRTKHYKTVCIISFLIFKHASTADPRIAKRPRRYHTLCCSCQACLLHGGVSQDAAMQHCGLAWDKTHFWQHHNFFFAVYYMLVVCTEAHGGNI